MKKFVVIGSGAASVESGRGIKRTFLDTEEDAVAHAGRLLGKDMDASLLVCEVVQTVRLATPALDVKPGFQVGDIV